MPAFAIAKSNNIKSAKEAGLRYVDEQSRGIARKRNGHGFAYVGPSGRTLHDHTTLRRIGALVIPPAWKNVWICPDPRGHIQAIGFDQRGRKQYRYHAQWRTVRDGNKFDRMLDFGKALPKIRRALRRDLRKPELPREKILATVVKLLETTFIRVGNEEYSRDNNSFGLTTLHDRHVAINGSKIHFEFRGKSGVQRAVDLHDKRLAKIVRASKEIPGQELFQFVDDAGKRHGIRSTDVNEYLQQIAGDQFTAKDFRTWAGTVLATECLLQLDPCRSPAQAKKNVVETVASVAKRLGNTTAVCRKCYIHPAVLEAYLEQTNWESLKKRATGTGSNRSLHSERATLTLLRSIVKTK